ncbi:MAG TPA: hypothetical protein VHX61_13370 [Rhizomicrobium sp.]|nr:hypothetical protein [Rhizomicrobium sp.]
MSALPRFTRFKEETMHGLWARNRQNGQHQEFLHEELEFDRFGGDYESPDADAADKVISEMGLVLVTVLGVVLAINMVLVAFHIG